MTVPLRRELIVNFATGRSVTRTLCGRLPVHRNRTLSPLSMLSELVPEPTPAGRPCTVFVAAKAGTASTAQQAGDDEHGDESLHGEASPPGVAG